MPVLHWEKIVALDALLNYTHSWSYNVCSFIPYIWLSFEFRWTLNFSMDSFWYFWWAFAFNRMHPIFVCVCVFYSPLVRFLSSCIDIKPILWLNSLLIVIFTANMSLHKQFMCFPFSNLTHPEKCHWVRDQNARKPGVFAVSVFYQDAESHVNINTESRSIPYVIVMSKYFKMSAWWRCWLVVRYLTLPILLLFQTKDTVNTIVACMCHVIL